MFKNMLLLIGGVFFLSILVCGQCPDKDSLIKRLNSYAIDSSTTATPKQLNELKQFEIRLKGCSYQGDSTHVLLLQRIGVLYLKRHDYIHAIQYIKFSNNLITTRGKKHAVDPAALIRNYYILSSSYDGLHMNAEKMAFFDSCIVTYNRLKNDKNIEKYIKYVLVALENRARSLYDIGEYSHCKTYALMGERLNQKYFDTSKKDSLDRSISFLTYRVNTLLTTQDYKQAEQLLEHAADDSKKYNSAESLGTIYDLLGQVQISKGNPQKAKDCFQQSLDYGLKLEQMLACMQTYNNLGYYLYDKGYWDSKAALASYQKGLACFYQIKDVEESDRMEALNVLANIANLYVHSRSYDSAFRYFQLAFDQIKPGLQEKDLLNRSLNDFTKIEYVTGLMLDKADAYYQLYKEQKKKSFFDSAINLYKITDKLLDNIKMEQSDIQSKLFWRRDNHRLYEHAIEACYSFGNKTNEAFYFFEKSRAILLNDQMTEQLFLGNKDILTQARLKHIILTLQKKLDTLDVRSEHYSGVQNELMQYNEELDRLMKNNKTKNLHAYQKFSDSSSVTIKSVQKNMLKDHKAMVELFEGDSAIYMITITSGKAEFDRISKTDYDSTLKLYLSYISDYSLLNRNLDKYYATARHLYTLLFHDKALPKGRIIVSPDGRYFPFEALLTNNKKDPAYFLYKYAVSYTYSARYLLMVNNQSHKTGPDVKTFLGIAPVSYKYDATLPDLLESDASVRKVQSYFTGADIMMHEQATKANFVNRGYNYKIIYLSTHASDSGKRGEPVIYFADDAMSLSELVAETKPETELIIASACKTGLGKVYRGEGVYNFSRGFASFGIPACVNNLWSVQAASANQLTELFCKYIAAGQPTDVALQKAKIEFIQSAKGNQQLPYYWAASILSGKTGVIKVEKPFRWKTTVILSLLAVLLVSGAAGFLLKKIHEPAINE